MITSKISKWSLANKRVFIRADLNVPLADGKIINDFRLNAVLPTIHYVIEQEGSVVLATHLGNPKDREAHLSTQILIPWFKAKGYEIVFAPDLTALTQTKIIPRQILLLENMRFFNGETSGSPLFAKQLAATATFYINDAFGVSHRADCSVSLLPYEFPQQRRSIGFLIEKELSVLDMLREKPQHPFLAILGGEKIKDKIPLMYGLMDTATTILLCPALVFSFLKAQGMSVGKSLIDENSLETCKKLLHHAQDKNVSILFPKDYQVTHGSFDGPLSIIENNTFGENDIGISIGPKTITEWSEKIKTAKTVFFNGAMGFADYQQTRLGTNALLTAMAHTSGTTIVAGGDTTAAAFSLNVVSSIDHLSTGGGATLAYLGGKQLPGLVAFEEE